MAKKGADGLDKRQRGALVRRGRRKQIIEGLVGGQTKRRLCSKRLSCWKWKSELPSFLYLCPSFWSHKK